MKTNAKFVALALLAGLVPSACTTTSAGLDLGIRGILSLLLRRESSSIVVRATATVADNNLVATNIELAEDQILSVNGTDLTKTPILNFNAEVSATFDSVHEPDPYAIIFDNQGDAASQDVVPPMDFSNTSPNPGATVQKDGFSVAWSPSGEDDVLIDIELSGFGPDGNDDGNSPDLVFKSFAGLVNDGAASIGEADLVDFNTGDLAITLRRYRLFDQDLGFAGGQIRVEIFDEIAVTLE